PGGRMLWDTPLLGEIYNDQIRLRSDGVLYTQDAQYGWAPATDRDGAPLSLARQRRLVQPYQPVAGGGQLVVDPGPSPRDWRIGLATMSGDLRQSWRVVGADDPGGGGWNAGIGGGAVLRFRVGGVKPVLQDLRVARLSYPGGRVQIF